MANTIENSDIQPVEPIVPEVVKVVQASVKEVIVAPVVKKFDTKVFIQMLEEARDHFVDLYGSTWDAEASVLAKECGILASKLLIKG